MNNSNKEEKGLLNLKLTDIFYEYDNLLSSN